MKPAAAWISVLALFLVGVLMGGLAVHLWYAAGDPGGPGTRPPRPHPAEGLPRAAAWLDELDLTEAQRAEIERIRAESHEEAERLRDRWEPQLRRHLAETRARIDAVLTEEQRARFRDLRERHHDRAERYFLGDRHHRPRRPGLRD